jgi:coenzyme F420-reducing hydrogenase gamma subunit
MDFAEGVTVISEGACSACRGTIHSVLYDIEQMKMMGEIRNLFIVVGSNAEPPADLPNTPLIMGTCLKRHEGKGCYVEGCPPNNDKMMAAIREICEIE